MEKNNSINMVNRVKATMGIEGFIISKEHLRTLKSVADGKVDAEKLIAQRKDELLRKRG